MSDPERPGPETEGQGTPDGRGPASGGFPAVSPPRGVVWEEPLSPLISGWLSDFAKATKALRMYAENNEMLQKFLERSWTGLSEVFAQLPELTLAVREDRFLYGKDPVHVNPDREDGIPFVFYRNAFRKLTFVRGMERDELLGFMRAIVTDYSKAFDYAGEDLVTALWRLQLPHLRYLTIDALTLDRRKVTKSEADDGELERIQADIDQIVALIYKSNTTEDDIVAGVSITREDLEALKAIRMEDQEDLDLLDHATARAITDVPPGRLEEAHNFLAADDRNALVARMLDILVEILFKEQSAREAGTTIELLQQLFDSMVLAQRYRDATELIRRIHGSTAVSDHIQEMHIARHLLKLFATESRVLPVLAALNEGYKTSSVSEMVDFLRALGADTTPILLAALDTLNSPAHRRVVCELIAELGVPELPVLMERVRSAKWFVVRDVLQLAQLHAPERIAPLIAHALTHEHPKVREHAVGLLRGYARGTADKLLAERLGDEDLEVRLAAIRVAALRRSPDCKAKLESILSRDDLADREPKELRLLMAAHAAIAGPAAIPVLDGILNPGFFARRKSTETQVAAAFALASLGPEAVPALQRGMRTLNPRVRDACRRAANRELGKEGEGERRIPGATTNPGTSIPAAGTNPGSQRPGPRTNPGPSPGPKSALGIPAASSDPGLFVPGQRGELSSRIPAVGTDPGKPSRGGPGTNPRGRLAGWGELSGEAGNAADLDFSIGPAPSADPLEGAPPFDPNISLVGVSAAAAPVLAYRRERPAMPRVERPHAAREQLPDRLLPPSVERDDSPLTPLPTTRATEYVLHNTARIGSTPRPAEPRLAPISEVLDRELAEAPAEEELVILEPAELPPPRPPAPAPMSSKAPLPGLVDDLFLEDG